MEPAKNDPKDDKDGSKAKLVAKLWIAGLASTYGGCDNSIGQRLLLQQQQKQQQQQKNKKLSSHLNPALGPLIALPSSSSTTADAAKHQQADIDEAVRLIRARTLQRSGDAASLEELSTVMLGLCRLVADNAKQLVVSADKAEDELMNTDEVVEDEEDEDQTGGRLMAQNKRKLDDDEGEDKEDEEIGTATPVKRKKLRIDKVTQLPPKIGADEEDEENDEETLEDGPEEEDALLLEKKVPDFGLPTKLAMEQSGCGRCCCTSGGDLPRSAGRLLPAKLAYLYERKCCTSGGGGCSTKTTKKTARRRRSMTCDSGGGGGGRTADAVGSGSGNDGGGKRARVGESPADAAAAGDVDKVLVHEEDEDTAKEKEKKEQQQLQLNQQQQRQQSPQSSNTSSAYQACVKDPLNEPISSLPLDYDEEEEEGYDDDDEDEEEEEEMTLNMLLQLYGGEQEMMMKKKKKKETAGDLQQQQQQPHYLPVRWRHMMTGTSATSDVQQGRPPPQSLPLPSSSSRAPLDSDRRLTMDERASLFSRGSIRTRSTVRSTATAGQRQQQQQLQQFGSYGSAADARALPGHATAQSIKSIIYARELRPPQPWWWQPVTPIPPPFRAQLASHAAAVHQHRSTGSVKSRLCGGSTRSSLLNSDLLQQRLLAILATRSCRGTIRVYELEQLVRAATATGTGTAVPLSKQVVAAHFVALLRMDATVRLRQKAAGGRRRPGLRLADFSSPSTAAAAHKIYVSLVVNETKEKKEEEAMEMKPPQSDFPPPPQPPATESAPFSA